MTGARRPAKLAAAAVLVLLAVSTIGTPAASAAQSVGLGTAESFGVLAGSGITNIGNTFIHGDIGSSPTPAITGTASMTVTGVNHADDNVADDAKADLGIAYLDAFGRTPETAVAVELGGSTLLPGVYTSPTLGLTGELTLDAAGDPTAVFVFKAGTTLTTATDSSVRLINGANPCRVVWQIGSSATFGTRTQFVGDVLADTSITANRQATFIGRLLAMNGAVTLDTNTITSGACAVGAPSGAGVTGLGPAPTTTTTTATATATATTAVPASSPTTAMTSTTTPQGAATVTEPSSRTVTAGVEGLASSGFVPAHPDGTFGGSARFAARGPGAPSAAPGAPPFLPRTGPGNGQLLTAAALLLVLGALASAAGRRRGAAAG